MPQVEWEFNKLKIKVQEEDELNNNKHEKKMFKLLAFFGVLHLHSYLLNSSLDYRRAHSPVVLKCDPRGIRLATRRWRLTTMMLMMRKIGSKLSNNGKCKAYVNLMGGVAK